MMKKIITILMTSFSMILLTGCASSGTTYDANSIGQVSQVEQGTVISIQKVKIKGKSGDGARVGAATGGFAASISRTGSTIGNIASSIGGAIVGGVAGGAAEKAITSSKAYQIRVKTDSGKEMSVLQDSSNNLKAGDKVNILLSGNNTRVVPLS